MSNAGWLTSDLETARRCGIASATCTAQSCPPLRLPCIGLSSTYLRSAESSSAIIEMRPAVACCSDHATTAWAPGQSTSPRSWQVDDSRCVQISSLPRQDMCSRTKLVCQRTIVRDCDGRIVGLVHFFSSSQLQLYSLQCARVEHVGCVSSQQWVLRAWHSFDARRTAR
jgi:hypothetical protein